MTRNATTSLTVAGMLMFGAAVFAQSAGQQNPQPQTQTSARAATDQITVTGCIQREEDYRKAHDAGRGGVVGTGVGAGNEFVLIEASASAATAAPRSPEPAPTGTTGSAMSSMSYELSGPNEGQVGQYVNHRVEITGKLKAAETDAAGQPTGGVTAGKPPTGVDVVSKDLRLRELEVTSVRESAGTCSPMKK
jgi:hypothetical protein